MWQSAAIIETAEATVGAVCCHHKWSLMHQISDTNQRAGLMEDGMPVEMPPALTATLEHVEQEMRARGCVTRCVTRTSQDEDADHEHALHVVVTRLVVSHEHEEALVVRAEVDARKHLCESGSLGYDSLRRSASHT